MSEKGALPKSAILASLGCGNPNALTQLQPGETILDLGSGGGIDMTNEMLALARENQKKAGDSFGTKSKRGIRGRCWRYTI